MKEFLQTYYHDMAEIAKMKARMGELEKSFQSCLLSKAPLSDEDLKEYGNLAFSFFESKFRLNNYINLFFKDKDIVGKTAIQLSTGESFTVLSQKNGILSLSNSDKRMTGNFTEFVFEFYSEK